MSTETKTSDHMSKQDLWSFIANKRATQSASLKVLQQFILSLNKQELRHLIDCYLKSKLSTHDIGESTLKYSVNKFINKNTKNSIDTMDEQILYKMKQKYGNKYNKKLLKKMEQNPTKNKHILSVNPQILAYSFQYLSYRELCKIEPVCSYFTYLHRKYQALSHFFIKLDKKFWFKAMRNEINLDILSSFKYINISGCYQSYSNYDPLARRRTKLFIYILNLIIRQSLNCFDILEIDIERGADCGNYWLSRFTVFEYILDTFTSPLPITRVIWKRDTLQCHNKEKVKSILDDIGEKVMQKMPKLQQFSLGLNSGCFEWIPIGRRVYTLPPITHSIIIPIINGYNSLKSLCLYCPLRNIYKNDKQIIESITMKLKCLETLSITSSIQQTHNININKQEIICNPSLKEMNLEFVMKANDNFTGIGKKIECILSKLFSSFIGIKHFQFGFSVKQIWQHRLTQSVQLAIDWKNIFGELFRNKSVYSMDHESVSCLESLQFDQILIKDGKRAIKELMAFKDEIYFNLKRFGVNIVGLTRDEMTQNEFNMFMNDYMIRFIESIENKSKLQHLNISYGDGYKQLVETVSICREYIDKSIPIQIEESYFEPIICLLSNIPKSLISLQLKAPKYTGNGDGKSSKIKEMESTKLVKKLCEMLAENESNLESVGLDQIKLSQKAGEYLTFIFGYNNKLLFNNNKYYLRFI